MSDAAGTAGRKFTKAEMLGFFAEVDAGLPPGEPIRIVVIGGAAVSFFAPSRVTDDVDVISEGMPQVLTDVAAQVARRHGIRRRWINDAARVVQPTVEWDLGEVYVGERLEVWRTGPQYLLATKLLAGRPVDVEDAVPLAVAAGITTEEAMEDLVTKAYPSRLLTPALQYRIAQVAAEVAEALRTRLNDQQGDTPQ